jgi:hypothetical protein
MFMKTAVGAHLRRISTCGLFQATLAILDKLDIDSDRPSDEQVARMFGYEEAYFAGTLTNWQKLKPKIWALFDEPYSSSSAKVPPNNVQHRNVIGFLLTILLFHSSRVDLVHCLAANLTNPSGETVHTPALSHLSPHPN